MGVGAAAHPINLGTVVGRGVDMASTGVRVNPIGILVTGLFTPGKLGDGSLKLPPGAYSIRIAGEDIEANRSSISEEDKAKALEASKAIAKEMEKTCSKSNKECSNQQHNGRIQAQNGTSMIVTATEAGSVWTKHPYPPPFLLCKQYATSMRIAMLRLQGHSKPEEKIKSPVDYHKGATVAYHNLVKWLEKNTPNGVTAYLKWSFSFDGSDSRGMVIGDSRRIDIDILKGEILKSF